MAPDVAYVEDSIWVRLGLQWFFVAWVGSSVPCYYRMEGGVELVQFLRENGLKTAVLTRNLEKNVAFMRDMYHDDIMKSSKGGDYSTGPIFQPIVARDTITHK